MTPVSGLVYDGKRPGSSSKPDRWVIQGSVSIVPIFDQADDPGEVARQRAFREQSSVPSGRWKVGWLELDLVGGDPDVDEPTAAGGDSSRTPPTSSRYGARRVDHDVGKVAVGRGSQVRLDRLAGWMRVLDAHLRPAEVEPAWRSCP